MKILVPEPNKKPGVSYAVTDDGLELPVIDVTHPAFAVSMTDGELAALTAAFIEEVERQQKMPLIVQRFFMRAFLRKSAVGRGLLAARGTFLSGMSTYLMKLGPDNLGSYAVPVDRKITASLPPLSMRLRLQDVAHLSADALAPQLEASPGRSLHFVNIAGGPAIDNVNTLILLRRDRPAFLDGRPIAIHVLYQDEAGPSFGARALQALVAPGGKLHGLQVSFDHLRYDWRDADRLTRVLVELELAGAVWTASSEGGLFEYGSDDEIVANLNALRSAAGPGTVVVGTVTRDEGVAKITRGQSGIATRPRSVSAFQALAAQGGWALDTVIQGPFSFSVRLR